MNKGQNKAKLHHFEQVEHALGEPEEGEHKGGGSY